MENITHIQIGYDGGGWDWDADNYGRLHLSSQGIIRELYCHMVITN